MSEQLYDPDQKRRLDDLIWSNEVADAARNGLPMPVRDPPPAAPAPPLEMPPAPIVVPPLADPQQAEEAARAALIAAVSYLHECDAESARCAYHVARQRERIADLQVALQPYENLDARLIASQLDRLKADQSDELPADLLAQCTERGRLIDRNDLAAKSLDVLLLEAELSSTRAKAAYATASQAATKMIVTRLSQRMTVIRELEAEAAEHRSELLSLAETWLPGSVPNQPRAVELPFAVLTLLREPPVNSVARATPALRRGCTELHAALLEDPSLMFDGLIVARETTYG